jgi:hypothetical protein
MVSKNIIQSVSKHTVTQPGVHTTKFWRVDSAVVLQKILVEITGARPGYLGPPESFCRLQNNQPL